jgi:molybdenum cofactor synthesis domain-containing protein
MHKAGILTVSIKGTKSELNDACNDLISKALHSIKVTVARCEDVAARESTITNTLALWADSGEVDFIITSGGTGIGPDDVTPEATRSVIDKEIPGIAEIMRLDGFKKSPSAILSRAVVGIRGKCLIINLPGNPAAVEEYLDLLLPIIPHAVDDLRY